MVREQERLRWRSRRGLLELDLLLERFLAIHLGTMGPEEIRIYDALLRLADKDFLDLVMGEALSPDASWGTVLDKIRKA